MSVSIAAELLRRVPLERLGRKLLLAALAGTLYDRHLARWAIAVDLNDPSGARVLGASGPVPGVEILFARGPSAIAPPGPAELGELEGARLLGVGLWPGGAAAASLILGLEMEAPIPPVLRLLAEAQADAEAMWDHAIEAEAMRERAPGAQELTELRERVLQRLWHELLTPIALLRAAHEQLRALESDPIKMRPLQRIGSANERLGRLFDLLNDLLWARESPAVRRTAVQLAEGLVMQASSQLANDLTASGLTDDLAPLRVAATRLSDHVRALVPLVEEASAPASLETLMRRALVQSVQTAGDRKVNLTLSAVGTEQVPVRLLEETLAALLKNAFANTPDGSRIELKARRDRDGLSIEVRDFGVGISRARVDTLMAGLSEARDPTWYSTRKPFVFGAGGAGLDLLRLQALGGWRGWRFEADSTLCPHVDEESRGCPGNAAVCPHIPNADACAALPKGTLVRLRIP